MSGINLYSPSIKGFRLFTDLVFSDQKYLNRQNNTYEKILFDAGISFSIGNVINIYFRVDKKCYEARNNCLICDYHGRQTYRFVTVLGDRHNGR